MEGQYEYKKLDDGEYIFLEKNLHHYYDIDGFIRRVNGDISNLSESCTEFFRDNEALKQENEELRTNCSEKLLREVCQFISEKIDLFYGEPISREYYECYTDIRQHMKDKGIWRD